MVYEKKHLVLERGVLLEADSQVHTICISVLFFFNLLFTSHREDCNGKEC